MKPVLVTGASGFLGRALCPLLTARGWRIVPSGEAEAVVHLAQGKGPGMRSVAVDLTRGLLNLAPRTFVLASSGSAKDPRDDYGRAKREAEDLVLGSGLPRSVVLRFHTLFGAGLPPERLAARLGSASLVEVARPDGILLTPTHVADAAEAILRVLEHPSLSGVFDVAGPEALTVGEMARRLGKRVAPRDPLPGERDLAGDPAALKAVLGWAPARRFP